jgi:hypothetical protein
VITEEKGLGCQFGYIKFGRETELAADIGKTIVD